MSATADASRFQQLRQESSIAAANRALSAMRRGAQLRLEYRGGRPSWSLSGGKQVSAEVAAILVNHALVAPADAALFSDLPGQSWRYAQ
jgi:hypothetical protein